MNIQNISSVAYHPPGATVTNVVLKGVQFVQWWVERTASGENVVRGSLFAEDPDVAETLAGLAPATCDGTAGLTVTYIQAGASKTKTFLRVLFGTGSGSYMTTKQDPGGSDLRNRIEFSCSIPLGGTVGDVVKSAAPAAMAPSVTTQAVSAIAATAAAGNGTVTAVNGVATTAHGICWATHAQPTTADSTAAGSGGTGAVAFAASLAVLLPGTKYYVRAYATNSAGTSYGQQVEFTTLATTPTVTTSATNAAGSTSAICGGEVTSDGGAAILSRGVCWGASSNPTVSGRRTSNGSSLGVFTSSMTGLAPSTTYHVRAYAINAAGVAYGADVTITTGSAASGTTPDAVPTITTNSVGAIKADSAACGGNISSDGGHTITARGVCYSTSPDPTTADTCVASATNAAGDFAVLLSSLTPGTRYFARAYATNSRGTAYGQNRYFIPSA